MPDPKDNAMKENDILVRAADIASAYLTRNTIKPGEIAALVTSIHSALSQVEGRPPPPPPAREPAVAIKKSITPDYLICLEDGQRMKMLRRYLRTHYNLTPQAYRARWNLPPDYPMAAPNYTAARSKAAILVGFGKRKGPRRRKAGASEG